MTPAKGGIVPPAQTAIAPTPAPMPRARPNNPNGNAGYHPSTKAYEHSGPEHTSDDR